MIYAVQAAAGEPVKIGFSDNVSERISVLEAHYGRPLCILATFKGDKKTEREIHERFAHIRMGRTEQFQPTPELMEFLGRPLFVSVDPESVEEMEIQGNRVTILNVKGPRSESEALKECFRKTGVPASEVARRGMALWFVRHGLTPPPGWYLEKDDSPVWKVE